VLYAENPEGDLALRGVTGSGEHLYTELRQRDLGGGLDLKFDLFEDAAAKTGYMGRASERTFRARRFGITSTSNTEAEDNLLPPEELFDPDQSGEAWRVTETTNTTDGYVAGQDLHAGYGMLELPLSKSFRVMGGVRVENFHQEIDAVVPYEVEEEDDDDDDADEEEDTTGADRTDLDYLPAATVIYAITETMNARVAYGGTVARPQIRELAPFLNQDFVRRRTIRGNPDLTRTFIHNFDVRWEMFPTPTEVFAVSLFYKSFEDPIESVIVNQNGDITYENIEGAENYGAEFEARVGMGLVSKELEAFSAMANFALIHSEVRLSDEHARLATSARRPLAGQSPYVANLALGFEPNESPLSMFLYYNVFGRRIQDAGRQGLPDIYQEAFHSLDFTAFYKPNEHWSFGFSASNLLFQQEKFTQGGLNYSEVDPGISMGLSAGWSY
jgi:TonB-dependent receptor